MTERLRLAVCKCPPDMVAGDEGWQRLVAGSRALGRCACDRRTARHASALARALEGGGAYGSPEFGGRGWIVDPDREIVAETSPDDPVVVAALDRARVATAKREYPRYVEDLG